jgi:hypothetical protein
MDELSSFLIHPPLAFQAAVELAEAESRLPPIISPILKFECPPSKFWIVLSRDGGAIKVSYESMFLSRGVRISRCPPDTPKNN